MIRCKMQFESSGRVIEAYLNDYVFSGLRGPDAPIDYSEAAMDLSKSLGTSVIRQFFTNYKYGTQNTFSELAQVFVEGKISADDVINRMIETGTHYAGHIYQGMQSLRHSLMAVPLVKSEIKEMEALLLLKEIWYVIDAHIIGYRENTKYQVSLRQVKEAIHHFIFFIVWHYLDQSVGRYRNYLHADNVFSLAAMGH